MAFPLHREPYPDQASTRMIRALKAEAQGPLWHAVTAIQEYASKNRLVPSQSYPYQSTYDQSVLGPWPLTSYARLEVVEEETENDAVHPKTSSNVPDLDVTSHSPSIIEDKCNDATGIESGGRMERAIGQDSKPLDIAALDDPEDYTVLESIPKLSVSPTPKPTEPVKHDSCYIHNSPLPGLLFEAIVLAIDSLELHSHAAQPASTSQSR